MSLRRVVTITTVPGKAAEFAAAAAERMQDVQPEPGCEEFAIFHSVANPDRFYLVEQWADPKAWDVHEDLNRATRTQMGAGLRVPPITSEAYDRASSKR